MPLLPCECVTPGAMPTNQLLANIYCALYTLAQGGGPGTGNVTAGATLTSGSLVIGQGGSAIATTATGVGVLTALSMNTGNAGAFVVMDDDYGTPGNIVLTNGTIDGTNRVGYLGVPQNAQTGNYVTVLSDAGKHIFHASGAGAGDTYTIAANGSVAYVIGTAITFVNLDSNNLSIAINSDTLVLAGAGTTGTRTLAQYGIATAFKTTSTTWLISGTNLT